MKSLLATIVLISLLLSCDKRGKVGAQTVPYVLFFVVKKNGARLSDSTLNNTKLFYLKGGMKSYVSDFDRGRDEGPFSAYTLGVQGTRNIGFNSADDNIKDYYLEFPGGDIDTLFVNYRHVTEREAFSNSCYCYYPLEQVKYNGVTASPDPTITQQKVYRFDKP